jgi:signal transduction histidine kinase/ligand-binding sensor domain-containing protein/DNA-binding response OmpR family regulator
MRLKFLLCFLFIIGNFHLYSQTSDIRFRRVSPPGGFSFQAIHSFNQDKHGFIWMGGFDGVIRYDSKEIIRFTYNAEADDGLPSNITTGIVIDDDNKIWVSTDKGLCLFNHKTQQFNRINYTYENGTTSSKNLFSIQIDKNNTLWIADENSFGYLDREKGQLIRINNGLDNPPRLLYNDETNRMWLGTLDGSVYIVNTDEARVVKKIEGPGSLARTICTSHTEIWVGYQEHGARLYDLNGNLQKHYSYSKNPEFDIKSASIRKIWRDTRGRIWIGSYLGLFLSIGNEFNYYNIDEYEGLPHNSIYDIFEDKEGGIWVGTWSGGVAYIHHADNTFSNYRESKAPGSISDNMVSSFSQTHNGELFVGTEQGGVNKFDLETANFKEIPALENEGVLDVKALKVDKYGGLWVTCAFKGVYYRPHGERKFIHFEEGLEDGKHVSAKGVYALCQCDTGMWLGTNFGGVNFYNFKTKKISFKSNYAPFSSLQNLNIRSLLVDSRDNLWAATTNGIYQFHIPSGKSTHFNTNSDGNQKIKSQSVYFVSELSDGNIWMGTGGNAINIYNPKTGELSFFDANGLLEGKDVYGIIEGRNNNIWITSNYGLVLYNTAKKTSRRFVITDGIQGNLFNPNAIFKDKDENLYFGGTNGFSLFEPKLIRTNERKPNVFITNIQVNNRKIIPFQTSINEFEKIVLKPDETSLNFQFSADNYLLPEKNEFKYRLSNFVDSWVIDESKGAANFVNLPAGEYIFEVKASNNDGIWNETPARISIVIQQFWYRSTLAKIMYSLVLLTIILLIVRFYIERSKLKKALLIEKIRYDHEEHLNEMKLRFFTNISHEFRTPLTLISGPIKHLLHASNLTSDQQKKLDTVERNTNRLLLLINQIMDIRKVEKGLAKLNITKIDLVDFINEKMLSFSEEARSKNIELTFNYTNSICFIEADDEKLDKIIFNLLSNAFKYTPKNGKVAISLQSNNIQSHKFFSNQLSFGKIENEDFVEITVTDNGPGIDSDDLPKIFDRFESGKQKANTLNSSTGIGLNLCKDLTLMHRGVIIVQSTPDEGTQFAVQLPTKQKAQKIIYESHEKVKNIDSWESSSKKVRTKPKVNEKVKILVIEDNEDLRLYVVQLLKNYYNVLFAENGKRGLDVLKAHNIQLVISDVMMPQMDGFEFCQILKSQIETSHIPVILLTALSSNENTTTGLEKGADAYISKPFDDDVLLSQIENLLQQRKRLQESYSQKYITKQPIDIGSLDNYFLNKINSIIEKNIENESFSVDILAGEIGLSRSQLFRKLKQISNHSTSEYITMVKIKKATALLTSKNYNIDEVAFKAGFNSHSYFTKCFKKIHGQSPKEFVKNL